MKRLLTIAVALFMILTFMGGCSTEAEKVDYNISRQAEYFESERRVTVYNARTDNVILYCEGYINVSNNEYSELVITAKTGASTYKKNYVYLNEYTLYVVEDISGTHTDPYHYHLYFNTDVLPVIETKP